MAKTAKRGGQSLTAMIADRIRSAIISGEFAFGEHLSEDTLAAAFAVSRTPVREALGLLQVQDLVRVVPKSGTYVFTPTIEDIAQLCDHRVGLEIQALRLVPEGGHAALAAVLGDETRTMHEVAESGQMQEYGRADTRFHLAIVAACRNGYLERAYDTILGRVASLRTHLAINAAGEPARSLADHDLIVGYLAEGLREPALQVLADHIERTKANYRNAIERHPLATGTSRADRLRRRLSLPEAAEV